MNSAEEKSHRYTLPVERLKKFWSQRGIREKCLIGSAIGVAVVFLANQFIIEPFVRDQLRVKEDISTQSQLLEKYARAAQARQHLEKHLEELSGARENLHRRLLEGQTPSLAAAALQDTLQKLAAQHNISVQVMRVMQPRPLEMYISIPVLIEIQTRIPELTAFLYSIETNQKLLNVRKLNMRVVDLRNPLDVMASLMVEGFTLASQGKTASGENPP